MRALDALQLPEIGTFPLRRGAVLRVLRAAEEVFSPLDKPAERPSEPKRAGGVKVDVQSNSENAQATVRRRNRACT